MAADPAAVPAHAELRERPVTYLAEDGTLSATEDSPIKALMDAIPPAPFGKKLLPLYSAAQIATLERERDEALIARAKWKEQAEKYNTAIEELEAEVEAAESSASQLREALTDARENGLIYWEPNTERGHVQKALMLSRIDAALKGESQP